MNQFLHLLLYRLTVLRSYFSTPSMQFFREECKKNTTKLASRLRYSKRYTTFRNPQQTIVNPSVLIAQTTYR